MQKIEILFALFLASFAGQGQPVSSGEETQFSMVIYSGRRDPSWSGSAEDVKKFTARFDELRSKDAKELPPGALGYRGFMVSGFRSFDSIRVWKGTVEASRDGETVRWEDKDRALEKFFLEISKVHVSDKEYQEASADIEKK
jgi:hypothetical protein